jgi:Zn-finger nucleic acid-binding protein
MRLKADMESFKCDYCQSVFFPEKGGDDGVRVLGDPADQECPLCKLPLVHAVLAKNPILYCTSCKGMLILMGQLEGLIDEMREEHGAGAAPSAPDKEELSRKINCPQCHRPMDAHFYAGGGNAVIDSCEECSLIWLDRGVLVRIAHASDVHTPPESSSSEAFDSQPAQISNGLEEQVTTSLILDDAIDSLFK